MSRFPSLTFQLAAARPDSSLIGEATKLHRIKGKELRPYLRWVNKPQHRDPCVLVLAGVDSPVLDLHYGPTGRLLATGTEDGHVVLWDIQTGTVHGIRQHPQQALSNADARRRRMSVASSVADDGAERAAMEADVADVEVHGHHSTPLAVGEEHKGEDDDEESARQAHIEAMRKERKAKLQSEGKAPSVLEEAVASLRAKREAQRETPLKPVSVVKVRIHPVHSRYVVAADTERRIIQWDMSSGASRCLAPEGVLPEVGAQHAVHDNAITALEWNEDGTLLLSGDNEGFVCLWRFPSADGGHAAWDLLHKSHDGAIAPTMWVSWRAQEGAVTSCKFGAAGWMPELEINSTPQEPPSPSRYRSPTVVDGAARSQSAPATSNFGRGGGYLSSLRTSDSFRFDGVVGRTVDGGGLASLTVHRSGSSAQLSSSRNSLTLNLGGSSRSQSAKATLRGYDGGGDDDEGGESKTLYRSGVSYGSGVFRGVVSGNEEEPSKLDTPPVPPAAGAEPKPGDISSRIAALHVQQPVGRVGTGPPVLHGGPMVSPVIMGAHTHAMFPHGNAHALMASLPPRLRKQTRRALKPPPMKPSILAAVKGGSASTASRDAVVAHRHRPWTRRADHLSGTLRELHATTSRARTPQLRLTHDTEGDGEGGEGGDGTEDNLGATNASFASSVLESRNDTLVLAQSALLRTSASLPALSEWNSAKMRMATPAFMAKNKPPRPGATLDGPGSEDASQGMGANAFAFDVTWGEEDGLQGAYGDLDDIPIDDDDTASLAARTVRPTRCGVPALGRSFGSAHFVQFAGWPCGCVWLCGCVGVPTATCGCKPAPHVSPRRRR